MAAFFVTVFVLTFLWVELNYYVLRCSGHKFTILLSFTGGFVGCIYSYFSSSDYVIETRQMALISFSLIMFFVPVIVLHIASWLTLNVKPKTRHIIATCLAMVNTMAWPFFGVVTGCYVQLDCI